MRHQVKGYRLNRSMGHRTSLRRTMIKQLFEHEKIQTTLAKAKSIQPDAEKLITLARNAQKEMICSKSMPAVRLPPALATTAAK